MLGGDYNTLVLYSDDAANRLSEYSALRTQIETSVHQYPEEMAAVVEKLLEYEQSAIDDLDKTIAELTKKIDEDEALVSKLKKKEAEALKDQIKELKESRSDLSAKRALLLNRSIRLEQLRKQLADVQNAAINKSIMGFDASSREANLSADSILKESFATATPVGAIMTAALDTLMLFKTDIKLKGTDVKPGNQELMGYLFRDLSVRRGTAAPASTNADLNSLRATYSDLKDFKTLKPISIIAPDSIALTKATTSSSMLLRDLDELSTNFVLGQKTIELVTATRKDVISKAENDLHKSDAETDVQLKQKQLENALKAYADEPSEITKANYELAKDNLKLANAKLAKIQKQIDEQGANFDKDLALPTATLTAMNSRVEALSKSLAGSTDEKGTKAGNLGDYLRAEILYERLNDGTSIALWLDTDISSKGANQLTKSSPIFDVFTRGPMTSYSGGSVVSYQLRDLQGRIQLAGTVWSYAPYRKSSNIMKFECQGVHNQGKKFDYQIP